jgi:alkaline phosphatase D
MLVLTLLQLFVFLVVAANAQQEYKASTTGHRQERGNRLLFASCNRQTQPQSFWTALKALQPDGFIWVGDAVYAKDNSIEKLKVAYDTLLHNASYREFSKTTKVVGT